MIIYYKLDTKEIQRTEDNTLIPILPFNTTLDEKVEFYKEQGIGFVSTEEEVGTDIFNYNLNFDNEDNFVGISKK